MQKQRFALFAVLALEVGSVQAPPIQSLLKPHQWQKMLHDKEVMVHAQLQKLPTPEGRNPAAIRTPDQHRYSYYAAMLVTASPAMTRKILTDYRIYAQTIPYIDKADFYAASNTLHLEGGIWNYRLRSQVQFSEESDNWIKYEILVGSFAGLQGNIYFEPVGEKGTAIYMNGSQTGVKWPPRFIIEKGAEVVFSYVARRMRSYIESQKRGNSYGEQSGKEIPQPRSHL